MLTTTAGRLDRIAFGIFLVVLFCTPVFFIPSLAVPLQTGKAAFLLYGIAAAFVLWAIARLKDGVFSMPRSLYYLSLGIFGAAYTLSALFSGNREVSIAGSSLDLGTLAFMLPSLALFALAPLLVRSERDIIRSLSVLLYSFFAISLFHILRFIFGADFLDFGIFASVTSNLVGKWNDLGIFFGLSTILSLITLERVSLGGLGKVMMYGVFVFSLAMLAIVNFSAVWIVLALFSFILLVYRLSFEKGMAVGSRISYKVLSVLVLSLLFIFAGGPIGGYISNMFGTSQLEVRPSWQATIDVAKTSLANNPVFGIGPNRFSSEWFAHKPEGINQTIFWNVGFNYGIGLVPSLIVSTGLLGILSMLLSLVLFAILGLQALFRRSESPLARYLVLSTFFASAYLWVFSVIYVPSAQIWILTLAFSGLFIASMRADGAIDSKEWTTLEKPAASFVSVLLIVLAVIGAIAFVYFVSIKLAASVNYQKGVIAVNTRGDLDTGERLIAKAVSISPSDIYYQSLSEIYLTRLGMLFQDTKVSQADAQARFQALLPAAIRSAQEAVEFDPTNYRNHVALGRVFEAVVPLNIEGAYESAKQSYEAALSVNPQSPEIHLILARLEVVKKDNKAAKNEIIKALQLKSDYSDAIYLLAQIQISENNVDEAIQSVGAIATLNPQDPGVFFQLGILYYSSKDYKNAVLAFERAVALNPEYANARYFLGLSYYQVKEKTKAIAQFKEVQKTNPDNEEVKSIIKNLEAGEAPFAGPASAATSRESLPVRE